MPLVQPSSAAVSVTWVASISVGPFSPTASAIADGYGTVNVLILNREWKTPACQISPTAIANPIGARMVGEISLRPMLRHLA